MIAPTRPTPGYPVVRCPRCGRTLDPLWRSWRGEDGRLVIRAELVCPDRRCGYQEATA
jgi:hypothetical protein